MIEIGLPTVQDIFADASSGGVASQGVLHRQALTCHGKQGVGFAVFFVPSIPFRTTVRHRVLKCLRDSILAVAQVGPCTSEIYSLPQFIGSQWTR